MGICYIVLVNKNIQANSYFFFSFTKPLEGWYLRCKNLLKQNYNPNTSLLKAGFVLSTNNVYNFFLPEGEGGGDMYCEYCRKEGQGEHSCPQAWQKKAGLPGSFCPLCGQPGCYYHHQKVETLPDGKKKGSGQEFWFPSRKPAAPKGGMSAGF